LLPPTGVDFFASLLDDIVVNPPADIGVIGDNLAAQNVFGPLPKCLGDKFQAKFLPDRFEGYVDEAYLSGIPGKWNLMVFMARPEWS
jgi:hypothetical protein